MDAHGGFGEAIEATVPGVRVSVQGDSHFSVRMVRCPRPSKPAVVVNGALSSWDALNTIPTCDIVLMEVYTGVATMPDLTLGNACGALVIYMK